MVKLKYKGRNMNVAMIIVFALILFIYEDAFGPLKKGNTQYYVSSGIGIWGGKFRIKTRSEYVVADIE